MQCINQGLQAVFIKKSESEGVTACCGQCIVEFSIQFKIRGQFEVNVRKTEFFVRIKEIE